MSDAPEPAETVADDEDGPSTAQQVYDTLESVIHMIAQIADDLFTITKALGQIADAIPLEPKEDA